MFSVHKNATEIHCSIQSKHISSKNFIPCNLLQNMWANSMVYIGVISLLIAILEMDVKK